MAVAATLVTRAHPYGPEVGTAAKYPASKMPQAAICEVKLIGTDAGDQPFWQTAPVALAGAHYIEMLRIPGLCQPGQVLTVEFDNRQRRYIIVEVRADGTARLEAVADVAGIFPDELLNGDESRPAFWVDPNSNPGEQPLAPVQVVSKKTGTRRYVRRKLRTAVVVRDRNSGRDVCGEMTEMSAGGCYVEMWSPLPFGTEVEVRCDATSICFRAAGRVVYSDPLVGMGIGFAAPCFVAADPADELVTPPAEASASMLASPQANTRLAIAVQQWFADHNFLEKVDFLKMLESAARN